MQARPAPVAAARHAQANEAASKDNAPGAEAAGAAAEALHEAPPAHKGDHNAPSASKAPASWGSSAPVKGKGAEKVKTGSKHKEHPVQAAPKVRRAAVVEPLQGCVEQQAHSVLGYVSDSVVMGRAAVMLSSTYSVCAYQGVLRDLIRRHEGDFMKATYVSAGLNKGQEGGFRIRRAGPEEARTR